MCTQIDRCQLGFEALRRFKAQNPFCGKDQLDCGRGHKEDVMSEDKSVNQSELIRRLELEKDWLLLSYLRQIPIEQRPQVLLSIIQDRILPVIENLPAKNQSGVCYVLTTYLASAVEDRYKSLDDAVEKRNQELAGLIAELGESITSRSIDFKPGSMMSMTWLVLPAVWCTTEDEARADQIFRFLLSILKQQPGNDVCSMIIDKVRENDKHCPSDRKRKAVTLLCQEIVNAKTPNDYFDRLLDVLAIGWFKNIPSWHKCFLMIKSKEASEEEFSAFKDILLKPVEL